MNSSVYIFGNLSSGYTQYPDEKSTSSIFQKFYTKAKATTQIAIRRDGNLMYYAYIRKLEQGKYIGLCVLLNGAALTKFEGLFSLFENVISNLVTKGYLIKYNDSDNLIANTEHLYMNREEIDLVAESLKGGFDSMQSTAMKLPPVNYAISSESVKEFVVEDDAKEILKSSYTNGYTYIYKSKGFNTALMNSYQGVLSRVSRERDEFKSRNVNLSLQLSKVKAQKRNFIWVSILGGVVLVLGVVVWNKVLFPSEVTRYQTEHFLYYGPMQNKKPHGEGVAFYPKDDQDGRRYYIGHFVNGERQDSTAMLYYQNGDYFFGTMNGDKFMKGIFYSNSDHSHFEGSFVDNKPYEGTWYNHEESYKLKDGRMK